MTLGGSSQLRASPFINPGFKGAFPSHQTKRYGNSSLGGTHLFGLYQQDPVLPCIKQYIDTHFNQMAWGGQVVSR